MTNKEKIAYYCKRIEVSRMMIARIFKEWEAWGAKVNKGV